MKYTVTLLICDIYMAKEANEFSLGAAGVFSYLNKIAFGIKHFAALNRKFDISYLDRSDLIHWSGEAKDLLIGI